MKMPGNMQAMMQQAQKMQQKMQEEVALIRVEGSSGGGMVTIKMDGHKNVTGVKIDPEVMGDVEMLQDLVQAACNEATKKVDEESQKKMSGMLGGLGLPHAETHAIMLPHVMRFNLEAAPEAKARLQEALDSDDPSGAVAAMLKKFPIPQRLRDVGFDAAKADFVAGEIAAASITAPRPASASDARELLAAAY